MHGAGAKATRHRTHIGKARLLLGLRPEHIVEQRQHMEPNQHAFAVELGVTEPMGMETGALTTTHRQNVLVTPLI